MIRLTQNGWALLGIGVLLYFASLTSQSSLLLFLIGALLGCFILNGWIACAQIAAVEVQAPASVRLTEGERSSDPWPLLNRSRRPIQCVTAAWSDQLLFQIAELGPKTMAHLTPQFAFERRGVFPLDAIWIRSSFPFGLIEARRKLSLAGELVVYPKLEHAPSPIASGYDGMVGGKLRSGVFARSGFDFAGVRPMQPSDSYRAIHWKASAKGTDWMVKTFEKELSGRVAIVFDAGSSGETTAFEACLRQAGSLAFAALDAGHHVEWIDLETLQAISLSPFGDGEVLLDRLARLGMRKNSLTKANLDEALGKVSSRAAITIVATEANDALRESIASWQTAGRRIAASGWNEQSMSVSADLHEPRL